VAAAGEVGFFLGGCLLLLVLLLVFLGRPLLPPLPLPDLPPRGRPYFDWPLGFVDAERA
jgi:hypothetical protein